MITEFVGDCCRVTLQAGKDSHIMFRAGSGEILSSTWLDEMIDLLLEARAYCETQEPALSNGKQYGWTAKKRERPKRAKRSRK